MLQANLDKIASHGAIGLAIAFFAERVGRFHVCAAIERSRANLCRGDLSWPRIS